jgi:photosystem II stability/assembly factor-like uncharacterized protein
MKFSIKLLAILLPSVLFLGCGSNGKTSTFASGATKSDDIALAINVAPVSYDVLLKVTKNSKGSFTLLAKDKDNDPVVFELVTNPKHGKITKFDKDTGTFIYVPNQGYVGKDSFKFRASDGVASCPEKTVNIDIGWQSLPIPKPPTNLKVSSSTQSCAVNLTWQDNSDNEDGFEIYQNGKLYRVNKANTTTALICGLEPDRVYKFEVRAKNASGSSKPAELLIKTVMDKERPKAPTKLRVTKKSDTIVRLAWEDNADNESGYDIYKDGVLLKTISPNCACTMISGLHANTSYTFEVRAKNSIGSSEPASITVTTKAPPVSTDTTPPVITLNGDSVITLKVGDKYIDAGATATDNKDGNITSKINTTGNVDTTKPGSYTITYNVKDMANNSAITVTRTVKVIKNISQLKIGDWTRTNPGAGGAFSMIGATAHGKYMVAGSDLSGVYIKENGSARWYARGENSGLLDTAVQALGFDSTNDEIFYVGTPNGIYKTENGGKKFKNITPASWSLADDGVLIESIVAGKNLLYTTYHTWTNEKHPSLISVSSDKGLTWEDLPSIVDANSTKVFHVTKLLIHPDDDKILYALSGNTRFGCSPAKAYRLLYDSAGKPSGWKEISQQPISDTLTHNTIDEVNSTIGIFDIDIDPKNKDILYMSTFNPKNCPSDTQEQVAMWEYVMNDNIGNIYKSIDKGDNFTLLEVDKTGIIFSLRGGEIRLANSFHFENAWNDRDDLNGTVAVWEYTPNTQTWQRYDDPKGWSIGPVINPNYSFIQSYYGISKTLTKDPFNENNIYATYGFNGASFDGGKTFKAISTTHLADDTWRSTGIDNIVGTSIDVSDSNKNSIYMGGYDIGLWVSKNHGKSWHMNIPQNADYSKYIWWQEFDGSEYANPGGSNVATLVVDPDDDAKVWATFSAAQDFSHAEVDEKTGLFRSTNYGKNWELLTGGDMLDNGRMYGLSIDKHSPKNNRTLYMTVNGLVFKSTDDGSTWKQKTPNSNGICDLNVMDVNVSTANGCGLKFTAVDSGDSNIVYAGGESGLWRSTDGGNNWSQIGGDIFEANRTRAYNMNRDIVPTYNEHQDDESKPYAWEGVFDIKPDPIVSKRVYVTVFGAGYADKGGLYRSDDAGDSWQKITLPSLHGIDPDRYLRGIAIDPNNSNNIFVSSSQAYHSGGDANTSVGILYSTDAGKSWKYANNNMAWNYGGMMDVENSTEHPRIWVWSPGTGLQYADLLK